jgi:hypothetical protein
MRRIWAAGLGLSLAWQSAVIAQDNPSQHLRPSLGKPVAFAEDEAPAVAPIRVAVYQASPGAGQVTKVRFQAPEEADPSVERATSFAADAEVGKGTIEPPVTTPPAPLTAAPMPGETPSANPLGWPAPPTRITTPLVNSMPASSFAGDGASVPELHEEIGDAVSGAPGTGNRFYVQTEYLLWWLKDPKNPPLVITGPSDFSTLNSPGSRVLNGGTVDYDPESGFRITGGFWLDDCHHIALETTFFTLGPNAKQFVDNSPVDAVIARPFFNQSTGMEDTELTSGPGLASGSILVRNTDRLWGLEENLRCNLCCDCTSRLDLLVGLRYVELDQGLIISENVMVGPAAIVPPAGSLGTVYDEFSTRNQFFGGQIGFDYEKHWGDWFVDARGKVALGNTHEILKISGQQTLTPPGGTTTTYNGGLLALPSNIGIYRRDRFTVLPELTLSVGYQFTENIRAYVGYNFLYWSNILSPGDQIDRVINPNQVPNFPPSAPVTGASHPLIPFKQNDFWAQGLNFGLEFRF